MLNAADFTQIALDAARAAGADQAEATFVRSNSFSSEARGATVAKLEQARARGLTLRVYVGGAKASVSTTDLRTDQVAELARAGVEAARFAAPDPYYGLSDEAVSWTGGDLGINDEAIVNSDRRLRVNETLDLEQRVRAFDDRITNTGGSRAGDAAATITYANSRGVHGTYDATSAWRSSSPIALDGTTKRNGFYGSASRRLAAVEDANEVAQLAARRAVEQCGARKPPTMRVPVIFDRDVASAVLSDIFSAVTASSIATGNSFLIDRIGERIGSDLVTIVDDGRLYGGLGTSPFDSEGTPTRRTVVFERGVLQTYLYDSYYGRKLGARTTGNASGGSIGPNNFLLLAGSQGAEELVASTARGVLVTGTIGFSTESATGTYSRGARGFLIENGELSHPIDECTIAGNLAEMLGAIDAVANDLRFDSSVSAPTFRVAEMIVSGS